MDVQLSYSEAGQGPVAIIQAPAWGPSSDYLRLTLAPLLEGFRVVTYDPRNVGGSSRVDHETAQATDLLVQDLEQLRIDLGIDRFLLLGHSHGGFIAMAYAVRHPEALEALVLLNTSVRRPSTSEEVESVLEWMERDPERRHAARLFRQTGGRLSGLKTDAELARRMRDLMPLYFYDLERMREFGRLARRARPPSAAALAKVPDEAEAWVEEDLPDVDVPTLVVTGRYDVATPPEEAERIRCLLPRARVAVFERSGHHPWVEEPEKFRAVLAAFVTELELGSATGGEGK